MQKDIPEEVITFIALLLAITSVVWMPVVALVNYFKRKSKHGAKVLL